MVNVSKFTVGAILLVSLLLMVTVSLGEAGTQDELAHIPAGYAYVSEFDFRLNPEHPPLVKMLAGFPLLFIDVNFPTDNLAWQSDVNGQWVMGGQFLYNSGNDADQIIQLSRIGPMLLMLLLTFFVYKWSKELMGPKWALLPTAITAFSPIFLAHGHYVTTDIGAALGTIVSIYYFVKFLTQPTRRNLLWAGIAFGIAMLMKFSTVLLVPLFLLLIFIYWLVEIYKTKGTISTKRVKHFFFLGLRYLKSVIIIFIVGFLVVYPLYFATTINYPPGRQLSDTEFILESFAGGPPGEGEVCNPTRCLAEFNIWAADKPFIRPYAQYMLGILMVIQRSAGGNTAFFLGEVSNAGSRLYFPVVYGLKEPLPILTLLTLALTFAIYRMGRAVARRKTNFVDYFSTHLAEFSMALFILIYTAWSINSPLNIGVRHLMPIMPFMYILGASGIKKWVQGNHLKRKIKLGLVYILTAWFLIDVAIAYPFYLSYFNEFVGTDNGWKYVTDSNYDWGQDLKKLVTFVEENNIERIGVDYFGAGDPNYYLREKSEYWYSAKGNPLESDIEWLAISVNQLQGAIAPAAGGFQRSPEDEYRWLDNPTEPYAVAGTSIFIYKLR